MPLFRRTLSESELIIVSDDSRPTARLITQTKAMAEPSTNGTTNGTAFRTDAQTATNGNVITSGLTLENENTLLKMSATDANDSPEVGPLCAVDGRAEWADHHKTHSGNSHSIVPLVTEDEKEYSCGLCSFRPKWLQKFANKQTFLAIFCLTSVLQGMYYTYFVSVLTTIEKLYQIQSKTTGMIMSATEIGQIGGALLLTYYGGHGHRPKWIACGMLIFALASILCSTPHYLFGSEVGSKLSLVTSGSVSPSEPLKSLKLSEYDDKLCFAGQSVWRPEIRPELGLDSDHIPSALNSSQTLSKCDQKETINTKSRITNTVLSIFFLSLLLIGIGATAVNTLGIPYIDDNVAPKESPLYFGINAILV